jgi:hypothetical protein
MRYLSGESSGAIEIARIGMLLVQATNQPKWAKRVMSATGELADHIVAASLQRSL